ncbi:MAG: DnaJ domain-containing protein [Acidimicrobiales bacterium]
MNHYDVIGVAPGEEPSAIRRAYLAAARRHHPDFHVDADAGTRASNAQRMQRLNEAWAVLGDAHARAAYDAQLTRSEAAGAARRLAREPMPPPGKGWTPRAGDDGWMSDFDSWVAEHDDLAPERSRTARHSVVTLLPVSCFAAAVACIALGGILTSRALLAMGVVALAMSVGLFVLLPVIEMTRGTRRR